MSFAPLYESHWIIVTHAFAAFAALALGALQIMLAKGGVRHRMVGYIWITLMAGVAGSSFWIHDLRQFGPFSLIHLLSIITLYSLVYAIWSARQGNISAHEKTMRSLFFLALIGAGAFTLVPGRIMHQVFFGQ
ncbi:MAG: DUF2306 domain-containing protein [Roseobacter sp.]